MWILSTSTCDTPNSTAIRIEYAITFCLDAKDLNPNHLRGFASDGANVMFGRRNRVATSLKRKVPNLINIHCANHRLALTAANAADNIPCLKKLCGTSKLALVYQNSTVHLPGLHAIEDIFNDPVIKLKEAIDMRWIPHEHAIQALIHILPSLMSSLER